MLYYFLKVKSMNSIYNKIYGFKNNFKYIQIPRMSQRKIKYK